MTGNRKTGSASNFKRRRGQTRRLGGLLPTSAGRVFKRAGFAESSIISNWGTIVGGELAQNSVPTQLRFKRGERTGGTLHVMVEGAFALKLQHMAPMLVEKINMFHGFQAVSGFNITQGQVESHRKRRRSRPHTLPQEDQGQLNDLVSGTRDDELKDALTRLGQSVFSGANSAGGEKA